jgi:hypothetical protein
VPAAEPATEAEAEALAAADAQKQAAAADAEADGAAAEQDAKSEPEPEAKSPLHIDNFPFSPEVRKTLQTSEPRALCSAVSHPFHAAFKIENLFPIQAQAFQHVRCSPFRPLTHELRPLMRSGASGV